MISATLVAGFCSIVAEHFSGQVEYSPLLIGCDSNIDQLRRLRHSCATWGENGE